MTDESPWAVPAIRARIDARLTELNLPAYTLPHSYKKGWHGRNGPTIRILTEIAASLNWTLPDVLGIHTEPTMKPSSVGLDPLLEGLMKRLPPPGTPWRDDHRKLWLQTLENCLQLIYPETVGTKNGSNAKVDPNP